MTPCPLAATLTTLETLGPQGQRDFIAMRAQACGGTIHEPDTGNTWDCQTFDLRLHGITAQGATCPELLRNWIKAATRVAKARADRRDRAAWAEAELARPGPHERRALTEACTFLTRNPQLTCDAVWRDARATLAALQNAT